MLIDRGRYRGRPALVYVWRGLCYVDVAVIWGAVGVGEKSGQLGCMMASFQDVGRGGWRKNWINATGVWGPPMNLNACRRTFVKIS